MVASHGLSAAELKQAEEARVASGTLKQRFAMLSKQHTNKCSLASIDLDKIAVRGRLQGSCCERMVYGHYAKQIPALKAYATVSEIPADRYDVPVALAKRLISYDHSITERTYRLMLRVRGGINHIADGLTNRRALGLTACGLGLIEPEDLRAPEKTKR
jgi:hypothetical protein